MFGDDIEAMRLGLNAPVYNEGDYEGPGTPETPAKCVDEGWENTTRFDDLQPSKSSSLLRSAGALPCLFTEPATFLQRSNVMATRKYRILTPTQRTSPPPLPAHQRNGRPKSEWTLQDGTSTLMIHRL